MTNNDNIRNRLSRNILADGLDPIMDLNKSFGSYIVDERNGDEYLDMFSMYASGAIGYNHPKLLSRKHELLDASLIKPTLSDVYNRTYAECLDVFNEHIFPDYLSKAFFIEGGALGVENALKAAFDWKTRLNFAKNKKTEATKIIHFEKAFHGRTGYTLSLTNTSDPRKTMYFPKFDWPRIVPPVMSFPIDNSSIEETIHIERRAINQIKEAITSFSDEIAAIIIEPIQGEGGDNHFRDDFFVKLRNISDENDMLLIFDEVQTGVGITGKKWAHEHFSVVPDLMSFGKKTQVCGFLCGNRIEEVENHVFSESSRINSTFGGNLTDMVRFKIMLEIISEERLIDNAKNNGDYLLNSIEGLCDSFPAFITNPRGKGLFCAFDLPSQFERDNAVQAMMDNKLLILPSGDQSIRFRPHLNVSSSDIDAAIDIISKSIKSILK